MKKETDRELEIFMKNVAYLRKTNGLSKKKMAEILGISTATLNKIEVGDFPPRTKANIFIRIYRRFAVRPSEILARFLE